MAAPRRAAASDDATLEDLGTVTPARRAAGGAAARGRLTRMALAPLAALSVTGLAAGLLLLPPTDPGTTEGGQASPVHASPLAVSRSQVRPTLSAPETAAPAAPAVETPEPTPAPEPAVDYGKLAEAAGTRYASAPVNVRTGPGTGFDVRTALAEGGEVTITSWAVDGWHQVSLKDKAGWIKGTFLTETKPEPKPAPKAAPQEAGKQASSAAGASSSSGFSGAACEKAGGLERNLTDRTATVLRAVCAEFPKASSYGGYRPDSDSYHGSGRAIDVMVSGEYGWQIAKWARNNASSLGIVEVIYEQKIWTSQRAGDGWRGMANRGSTSANHYDHVHISVR
ncbi:SH3 domain-containing protein [Tessaracoccus massiliensis]|uniref:SH3 domain-containing protein n=1 Tax=Tessaracoccus massiliensis TaxID=1522311 RepID=UPI001119E686|nr:hypothetical protein [Tessaracoccus massiliensis]